MTTSWHRYSSLWRLSTACLSTLVLAAFAQSAAAAEEQSAARKLGRGFANIVTAPLEIPGNMVQEGRANGIFQGATIGLFVGLGKVVVRPLVGAYEILTAPFEAPDDFEPIIDPEFTWNYFESQPPVRSYQFVRYLDAEKQALEEISGAEVVRDDGALVVRMPDALQFGLGSATLSPEALKKLRAMAGILKEYPDTRITVAGYTDLSGDTAANDALSRSRANSVRTYLLQQGIAAERVDAVGWGESSPVASNDLHTGRSANRRVELEVRAGGVAAYH